MRTLNKLSAFVMLAFALASTHAAAQAPLLAPLQNQDRVPGCAWLASAPSLGEGYMFMAEYDDSAAWMNIDGDDAVLELVEARGSLHSVGDVMERIYRAAGVDVLARYTVTWVCPADTESCEVTRFGATFEVTTADHIQIVAASGAMGC
jgi:hypothetical protein